MWDYRLHAEKKKKRETENATVSSIQTLIKGVFGLNLLLLKTEITVAK